MYHPQVVAATVRAFEARLRPASPLRPYSIPEVDEFLDSLRSAYDERGEPARPLLDAEQTFIVNETLLCKADFAYWAERYAWINTKGMELVRMFPLWESQRLILAKMAELELATFEGERDDGILILILKARQLGASSLAEACLVHRATTQTNVFGLVASDVPSSSSYLFAMFQRMVDNLPAFLCPLIRTVSRSFPEEIEFTTDTNIWCAAGASTRGTSKAQSERGSRGQIGRGKTLSLLHLSEVSGWNDPTQITGALEPTIPEPEPRVLAIYESTAKGSNSFWQRRWNLSKEGLTRFTATFIPWWIEVSKYRRRPPVSWSPSRSTIAYAERVLERSPHWTNGRSYQLSLEQMFWYETTRAAFEAEHALETFLEEYPADDDEAFQAVSSASLPATVLQRIIDESRPLLGAIEIASAAELQEEHPEDWRPTLGPGFSTQVAGGAADPSPLPSLIVPKGWGMRVLPERERRQLTDVADLFDHLLVWEPPRRGHRYVMSVDVSDGVGQDASVIDITRVATLSLPDEQVAQFATKTVDPIDLAFYCDVIGRFYVGADKQPAIAAIETAGHGLTTQAELQKHLGYFNLFIWQKEDARNPEGRFSNSVGFETNRRTRPIVVTRYLKRLKSGDYRLNSPITILELRTFRRAPGAPLGDSEADPLDPSAHDDAIICGAIGVHVAQTLHYEEGETVDQVRHRLAEERSRRALHSDLTGVQLDYYNSDLSTEEMTWLQGRAGILGRPRGLP
jgi:hypothetical protein